MLACTYPNIRREIQAEIPYMEIRNKESLIGSDLFVEMRLPCLCVNSKKVSFPRNQILGCYQIVTQHGILESASILRFQFLKQLNALLPYLGLRKV